MIVAGGHDGEEKGEEKGGEENGEGIPFSLENRPNRREKGEEFCEAILGIKPAVLIFRVFNSGDTNTMARAWPVCMELSRLRPVRRRNAKNKHPT